MVEKSDRLGDYEILGKIGEGGMGDVYLAANVHVPNIRVILKVLKDRVHKDRLIREATALSKFAHRNICQLRHVFSQEGKLIIVMEYVAGSTLAELSAEWRSIDLAEARRIFIQVLDGLAYAHAKGVSHRDIKPSNIMIDSDGVVKIIDFGIARHTDDVSFTSTGILVGTPRYMAPEQFTRDDIGDFSLCDIYSTGVTLYEHCCGRVPFEDTNPYILKDKHCNERPQRPSKINPGIPPSLERVILKAMAKEPSDRFESARDMLCALESVSLDLQERKPAEKTTLKWAALVLLLLIMGRIGYWVWEDYLREESRIVFAVEPQTIDEGEMFEQFDLRSALPDDPATNVVEWSFSGNRDLKVDVDRAGLVSITAPNENWSGSEEIWFKAVFSDGRVDSATGVFTVMNVNDPPVIAESISLNTTEGNSFGPIRLDDYVSDIEDPDSAIVWTWESTANLSTTISDERIVHVVPRKDWIGSENVTFTAVDPSGASTSLRGTFSVSRAVVSEHRLVLRVLPQGSKIEDALGKRYVDSVSTDVTTGAHQFTVYCRDLPIRRVALPMVSGDLDTTIDLSHIGDGGETGSLAVSVISGDREVLQREILLNHFRTNHMTTDSMRTLICGDYAVSIGLDDGSEIDSVLVEENRSYSHAPVVRIDADTKNRVRFYITESYKR